MLSDTKIGLPNIMFLSISHNLAFESEWRRASQEYKNAIASQDIPWKIKPATRTYYSAIIYAVINNFSLYLNSRVAT